MLKIILDMETQDPDDVLTLAMLADHPQVDLLAVTVTPGTPHQIGVVSHVLWLLEKESVPVGSFNINHTKGRGTPQEHYVTCVSDWHYKAFGPMEPISKTEVGWQLLERTLGPDTTLVTGAPLKNPGALLENTANSNLGRIFVQGGFAGQGVVPECDQLPKFKGLVSCPTFNLNGDPKAALRVLESKRFSERKMVSKNVCHGVTYTQEFHDKLRTMERSRQGLRLITRVMNSKIGKALHDPLTACCAIEPKIGKWAPVIVFRTVHDEWGSELSPESTTQIITSYDPNLFFRTFSAT